MRNVFTLLKTVCFISFFFVNAAAPSGVRESTSGVGTGPPPPPPTERYRNIERKRKKKRAKSQVYFFACSGNQATICTKLKYFPCESRACGSCINGAVISLPAIPAPLFVLYRSSPCAVFGVRESDSWNKGRKNISQKIKRGLPSIQMQRAFHVHSSKENLKRILNVT